MIKVLKNKETGRYVLGHYNAMWVGIPGWEYVGNYATRKEAVAAKKKIEEDRVMKIHATIYER